MTESTRASRVLPSCAHAVPGTIAVVRASTAVAHLIWSRIYASSAAAPCVADGTSCARNRGRILR